jgi:AAA domain
VIALDKEEVIIMGTVATSAVNGQLDNHPPLETGKMSKPSTSNELEMDKPTTGENTSGIPHHNSPDSESEQEYRRPVWALSSRAWVEQYEGEEHGSAELWGPILRKGTLTLMVGQSSVGKTVFLYRLTEALTAGKEFLGLTPPKPLRFLHIDLETPERGTV